MKKRIAAFLIFLLPFGLFAQNISQNSNIPNVHIIDCILKKDKRFIPGKFLNVMQFHENLAPVRIIDTTSLSAKGKIGFVNTNGQIVITPAFDSLVKHFHKGIAIVGVYNESKNLGKGIVDKKDKIIVPLSFNEIGDINHENVLVKDYTSQWGIYNTSLQKLVPPAYETIRFFKKGYCIVSNLGKRGMIDLTGKVIIPLNYKEISAKKDGSLDVKTFSHFAIKNLANVITNELECDSIISLEPDFYKYAINGKYGIIKNQKVASPAYDSISSFTRGKAIVKKNNFYGLIDTSGNVIVQLIHAKIFLDNYGLIYMSKNNAKQFGSYFGKDKKVLWSVVNQNLETIIPFLYKEVKPMGDSSFAVLNTGDKWGYVDYKGDEIILFKYDFVESFKNGLAAVGVRQPYKKKYTFINKKGEEIVSPENFAVYNAGIGEKDSLGKVNFHYEYNSFHKFSPINESFVKVKYGYKYGIANAASDLIVSIDYDSIIFSNNETCFIVYKDKQVGIFGAKGDTVHYLTDKYDNIQTFKEGYARVSKDGLYGYIDVHKNRRISIQYPQLHEIQEGMVGVVINGKWGFLDKNEALKVQPYYVEVKPFKNGLGRVKTGQYWDFVNRDGKIVNSSLYQAIEETSTGKWLLTYNGKTGMANEQGKEMVVPRYEALRDLGNGYVQVWKNSKTGVLNYDQNFILPIEHTNLEYDAINNNFIIHEPGAVEKFELANNLK